MSAPQGMKTSPPRRTVPRKSLFALSSLFFFLAALEVVCRILVPTPAKTFVETPGAVPGTRTLTYPHNWRSPSFTMPKPNSVFRIMVFGESAVEGYPVRGFPRWMEEIAAATSPAKTVEVINLGRAGINSTDIRSWYVSSLEMEPDLIILYVGNNDAYEYREINPLRHPVIFAFLDWFRDNSRTWIALRELLPTKEITFWLYPRLTHNSTREQTAMFPPEKRERANALYQKNLGDMVEAARRRNIPAVVAIPAVNLALQPSRSAHYHGLAAGKTSAKFDAVREQGEKLLAAGDPQQAQLLLQGLVEQDPTYAAACHDLARALEAQGNDQRAWEYYNAARQWDDVPLRTPDDFARVGSQLCEQSGCRFLDLNRELRRARPGKVAGFDLFYDHVHLTPAGEYEVALLLTRDLASARLIPLGEAPLPTYEELSPRLAFSNEERIFFETYRFVQEGFFPLGNESKIQEGIRNLDRLQQESGDDPFPRVVQAMLWARIGDPQRVGDALTAAARMNSHHAQGYARLFFGEAMELYQDQAVLRITPDTNWPEMGHGIMSYKKSAITLAAEPPEFGSISLEQMTGVYLWDRATKTYYEISAAAKALAHEKAKIPVGGVNHAR
jgi:lysophospholipase L1-like esterase